MLGAHALYKIDYLEVSSLYLFRKIWANGPLEQHKDLIMLGAHALYKIDYLKFIELQCCFNCCLNLFWLYLFC